MFKSIIVAAGLMVGAMSAAQAAPVIASYDMANATSAPTLAATSVAPGFTFGALTLVNPATTSSSFGNHFYHNGWGTTLDPNKYYSLTASAVGAFSLDTLSFSLENLSGTSTYTLRSSLDGYTSNIATGAFINGDVTNFSVSLASLGTISSALTLRWYITDSAGGASGFANHECPQAGCGLPDVGQDLVFTGELVAVPAPGALALLGFGLIAVAGVRRKAS